MIRLILLIAFVLALLIIIQQIKKVPKAQWGNMYWKLILGGLAIVLVLLAATGRIHWIGAMIGAALPFIRQSIRQSIPMLMRLFPFFQHLKRTQAQPPPSSGNHSKMKTKILDMTLDHDSKQLSGQVISGPFAGSRLDNMPLEQLQSLLEYCRQQEQDSAKLLISYLNHRFGHNWQEGTSNHTDSVTVDDINTAYSVLGLSPGASKDDIIKVHRKMMQKVHPDRGGSDYLAAQINQAKDLLLNQLND